MFRLATMAGGAAGYEEGPIPSARFNDPVAAAADVLGNVFVADAANHVIRRISPHGSVSLVAGRPTVAGFENGNGLQAMFNSPEGIVAGFSGDLFVADTMNHVIRHVDASGNVTTFAGAPQSPGWHDGRGAEVQFSSPVGITIDSRGYLYVTDYANHCVREISPDGTVRTLAGAPKQSGNADGFYDVARFTFPFGIVMTPHGDLLVSDSGNHTIRLVTIRGIVSTLFGASGQSGSADGRGRSSRFSRPTGIAVDPAGTVYVADTDNSTIRRIDSDGTVSTVAGLAETVGQGDGDPLVPRLHHPFGVTTDPAGRLIIIDTFNHRICTLEQRPSRRRGVHL